MLIKHGIFEKKKKKNFIQNLVTPERQEISVDMATRPKAGRSEKLLFDSRQGHNVLRSPNGPNHLWESTHPPVHWVIGIPSGGKAAGVLSYQLTLSRAQVNKCRCTFSSLRVSMDLTGTYLSLPTFQSLQFMFLGCF